MKTPLIICGPTASGKSSLAFKLAKEVDGEIINADGMQLYKNFPILSAQPPANEQEEIPHHLFSVLEGDTSFSAAKWCREVLKVISSCNSIPIIVGGTGFYLKALLEGLHDIPEIPQDVRLEVENMWQKDNGHTIYKLLEKAKIHVPLDPQRRKRQAEVLLYTGKPLSFYYESPPIKPLGNVYRVLTIVKEREGLLSSIQSRIHEMISEGAIEEVQSNLHLKEGDPAAKTLGFKEIKPYIQKECPLEESLEKWEISTRRYAKRQSTWFRHNGSSSAHIVSSLEEGLEWGISAINKD